MTDSEIHNILVILSLLQSDLCQDNVLILAKELYPDRMFSLSELQTMFTRIRCCITDFKL